MTLSSVRRGVAATPDRILVVGTEGVGKTSWAAGAPSPIFICAEDGMPRALSEVARFPAPETFDDVLEAVRTLTSSDHEFKALVIDTIDWLEPLIWAYVCKRDNKKDIEEYGYGKGYVAAADEWRRLLAALDVLRRAKGMEIILLAHASIRVFQNPAGADYARYECKLNKNAAALVKEWCDVNLFAIHEEFVTESDIEKKGKGVSTGRRVVKTTRCAAWDAKNRHGLPDELALDYATYAAAREAGAPADPAKLADEARELLAKWAPAPEVVEKVSTEIKFGVEHGSASHLAKVVDTLRTRVTQKGAA